MSRKRKAPQPTRRPPPPETRVGRTVARVAMTTLAAVATLLVAAYLFARTDGFRTFLESRLAEALGMPLEIGSSRALFNGSLVLGNVRTPDGQEPAHAGLHIDQARISLGWPQCLTDGLPEGVRAVEIDGWRVDFAPDADGRIQPAGLAAASDWLGHWGGVSVPGGLDLPPAGGGAVAAEPARPAPPPTNGLEQWQRIRMALRGGAMAWRDGQGNTIASAREIDFFLTPLQLPTRPAAHYHATVKSALVPGGERIHAMDVELLHAGETWLVLNLAAVRQTPTDPADMPAPLETAPPGRPP